MNRKLGVALVGLGTYSEEQLGPALKVTEHCHLTGIVTSHSNKAEKWKKEYNLSPGNIYTYDNFDEVRNNNEIDIVYVVLPNSLHADFVRRAAAAGKHIICERPMDVSVEKCEQMIAACEKAGVLLSIGYRLHFEPHNLAVMQLHKTGKYGKIKRIIAEHGQEVPDNVWRINKELAGGGPLMDMGIYCVQGAIYAAGEDPIAVKAKEGIKIKPEKFIGVEESLFWTMEFASGIIAECKTSYSETQNCLRVECENGWMELQPAFGYSGIKGKCSDGELNYPEINQQAVQMDDFAVCVKENKKSRVPGEMGLRDVKILNAIYQSMHSGERVELK